MGNIRNGFDIGSDRHFSRFNDDGRMRMYGNATGWDDMRFPASSINPSGQTSAADVEISGTFLGTLLFSPSAIEVCVGQGQFPHSMKQGSFIHPHIHWTPTSTDGGNVLWQFDYQIAGNDGVFPGSYTTLQSLGAAGTVNNKSLRTAFTHIEIPVSYGMSAMIVWKISRVGTDVTDTYPGDARLLEFDIHYEIDTIGSNTEYTK